MSGPVALQPQIGPALSGSHHALQKIVMSIKDADHLHTPVNCGGRMHIVQQLRNAAYRLCEFLGQV